MRVVDPADWRNLVSRWRFYRGLSVALRDGMLSTVCVGYDIRAEHRREFKRLTLLTALMVTLVVTQVAYVVYYGLKLARAAITLVATGGADGVYDFFLGLFGLTFMAATNFGPEVLKWYRAEPVSKRAAQLFALLAFLPKRYTNEELGDALELIARLEAQGAPRWKAVAVMLRAFAFVCFNFAKDFAAVVKIFGS